MVADVEIVEPSSLEAKKCRHTYPRASHVVNGVITYPFVHNPSPKELGMHRVLSVSRPYLVPRGKGVVEAWEAATAEINQQKNDEGKPLFDPPINAKSVRERFEAVMKACKGWKDTDPFRSGKSDKKAPNEMASLVKAMFEEKSLFDEGQLNMKQQTELKGQNDRKAIPIGEWTGQKMRKDATSSDSSDEELPDSSSKAGMKRKYENHRTAPPNAIKSRYDPEEIALTRREREAKIKLDETKIRREEARIKREDAAAERDKQMALLLKKLADKLDQP